METSVPIVWAKVAPPMLGAETVARPDLVDELVGPAGTSLTAIVAPAGYGKTTVAAQLVARLGGSPAWLALDPADDDPVRFWTYVAAALSTAGVAGVDVGALREPTHGLPIAVDGLRAATERHEADIVLVLDDVHHLADSTIEAGLADWLRHPMPGFRIICTSRHDLPLPVGRLRGQGRLTEARVDRLAFDARESSALLGGISGLADLSDDELHLLQQRTEGWPVGLHLAGLGLRHDPDAAGFVRRFAGDTRHLTEYLATEATENLSDDDRAFLLATSVITELEPDLCDELTGHPGSLGVLRRLVTENVFTVATNADGTRFRYHPLFRDHLRSTLAAEHPDSLGEVHRRASHWYERHGDIDGAVTHAVEAGDNGRACSLVAQSWEQMARSGLLATLERWVRILGDGATRDPEVAVMMAWNLLNTDRLDQIDHWLATAAAVAETAAERELVTVETAIVQAYVARHRGDVATLVDRAEAALDAADPDRPEPTTPGERRLLASGTAALTAAGVAAYWSGDGALARQRFVAALAHARHSGEFTSLTGGYGYLALIEAEAGHAELALAHADQVLALVDADAESFHRPVHAHLARSLALAAGGRLAEAADALTEARRIHDVRPEPLNAALLDLQAARLAHRRGDRAAARAALRTARSTVEHLPDPRFDQRLRAVAAEIRFVPTDAPDLPPGARELTERELAVLALLPHDLSRKELAAQLHVSENTVKTHLTAIRHKLGVTGRQSIVARAEELGLVTLRAPSEDSARLASLGQDDPLR